MFIHINNKKNVFPSYEENILNLSSEKSKLKDTLSVYDVIKIRLENINSGVLKEIDMSNQSLRNYNSMISDMNKKYIEDIDQDGNGIPDNVDRGDIDDNGMPDYLDRNGDGIPDY